MHKVGLTRDIGLAGREQELRDHLGSLRFTGTMVEQPVRSLSGGQKARLVLEERWLTLQGEIEKLTAAAALQARVARVRRPGRANPPPTRGGAGLDARKMSRI